MLVLNNMAPFLLQYQCKNSLALANLMKPIQLE